MATALTVEERLAIVEQELAELKKMMPGLASKPNWITRITGSFKDDPEFGEILRMGREIRKAEPMEEANGEA
jgi:hypothetical protein